MKSLIALCMVAGSLAVAVGAAVAATTVVVTPAHSQGWSTADTRPGGDVSFVSDATAPGGAALQLTTDATTAAKAQYMHETSTSLADVTELSYQAKQNSASAPVGDASYQLAVDLNGSADGGFTSLVYEPYWNGTVVPRVWQSWDVDAGQFWSSSTVTCADGGVAAGAGGPPLYTLSAISAMCPDAVVLGFGVNVGTFNPSYDVETDLVDFNGTVYDFQQDTVVSAKDQCKDGGWATVVRADGTGFTNQGDCIQYANTGK